MSLGSDSPDMLSRLPGEIVGMIANEAEEHTISLRSTCRDLQQKTRHAFLDRFFTHRHIWMDEDSLTSLDKLADVPELACHTKKLTLNLHRWDEKAIFEKWGPGTHLVGAEKDAFDHANTQVNKQRFLIQSGRGYLLLSSLMRKLPCLENFEMRSWEREWELWPVTHFKAIEHGGLVRDTHVDDEFHSIIWPMAMLALSESNVQLKYFGPGGYVSQHQLRNLMPQVLPSIPSVFRSINSLWLGLNVPALASERRLWKTALISFLHICSNVSDLDIKFSVSDDVEPFTSNPSGFASSTIAEWPTFPNLAHFTPVMSRIPLNTLIDFLWRHRSSLKFLDLAPTGVGTSLEDWRELLRHLRCEYTLDRVKTSARIVDEEDERHGHYFLDAVGPDIADAIQEALKPYPPGEGFWYASSGLYPDWIHDEDSDGEQGGDPMLVSMFDIVG